MELERAAPTYSETMWSTVDVPYKRGIGYIYEENKLGMVRDDYKLGDSLNGVATHECCPAIRSEITKG